MTTVTLTGWKEFEAKAKGLSKVLFAEIDGEVEDAARIWASGAKRDAPKDQGFLAGQISSRKTAMMQAETTSNANYSAYMEWGTKTRVQIPPDLQSYAAQFRGGTNQGNAKKMVFAWMDRVGIPKERQWITFLSIIIKGIRPHPFFFIQRPIVQSQLNKNVQAILNTPH